MEHIQELLRSLNNLNMSIMHHNGEYASIVENFNKLDILDYNLIIKKYANSVNKNLINYFFKKSKLNERFTDEEIEIYKDAYNFWFDLVFKMGKYNIFQISEELKDISILIKKDNDIFQMSKFNNINQIIYLKDYCI